MKLVWPVIVAIIVVTGASVALAQTQLDGKIRSGDQIVVSADETVDGDLYASGGQVRIEGTVDGDLLVWGGTVTITGEVTGDLMAAAGTVDVSGEVTGDARVAAGQLTLGGTIGEDLFVAAGQATVSSSGEVGEDLVFGNGRMTVDGAVAGDVLGATGAYDRQGTVGGSEDVTVNEREQVPTAAERFVDVVQRFIGILLVAALFLWLVPRLVDQPAETLRRRPLAALGVGVLALIGFGIVVALVILVAVLLAILLALVGLGDLVGAIVFAAILAVVGSVFLFFLAAVFGAPTWVGTTIGSMVLSAESTGRRWGALIIGLAIVVILTAIPVVGGLIGFVVVLFGLGALILSLWPRRTVAQPAEPVMM